MSLPPPTSTQAYCDVSALEAGTVDLPLAFFISTSPDSNAISTAPSLSFLLRHSTYQENFVFDLGIRKDWENYPPAVVEVIKQHLHVHVSQDVVESLEKGGISISKIATICLSHCHFDHIGDTRPFTEATFLVGAESAGVISPGYPADPASSFASELLPPTRTKYLSPTDWPPVGPFTHALDFYGDGSLYIVDAPGHLRGHLNILARTSRDGAWIYLAGDSAHHWDLLTGKSEVPVLGHVCAHEDKKTAEEHILRIRTLCDIPRVRVLLAHDEPWYEANKGGSAFWPGRIESL